MPRPPGARTFAAFATLALAGAAFTFVGATCAGAAAAAPEPPATLEAQDLAGAKTSLATLRGRPAVVNFWATWCVPCRREMPLLQALAERYADSVTFVAISADELSARSKVADDAAKLGVKFPVWIGATTQDMQRLGLGAELPATAVLDGDGRIVSRVVGVVDERQMTRRLDWLTSNRLTPQPWKSEPPVGARRARATGAGGASLVPS